jgi:hypothetical protein
MFVSGKPLGATGGHCDPTGGYASGAFPEPDEKDGVVDSPDAGRRAVRLNAKHGADVIKICATGGVLSLADAVDVPQLTDEELRAIISEAHDLGKAVRSGIRIALGTDAGVSPHGTNAGEFALMVKYGMTPEQALAAGTKNAADMRLAIDAMDLVRERDLDGMCIVSSDSDFAALAIRLRESGLAVYGFGEAKTPAPYAAACSVFRQLGDTPPPPTAKPTNARPAASPASPARDAQAASQPAAGSDGRVQPVTLWLPLPLPPPSKPGKAPVPVAEILASIAESASTDGWATLSNVRQRLGKHLPNFNLRSYGYRKFSDLVGAIDGIEKHQVKSGSGTSLAVRQRSVPPPA